MFHNNAVIRNVFHIGDIVGGEKYRFSSVPVLQVVPEHITELVAHQRVKRGGRLIQNEKFRVPCQYQRQHQLHSVAVRELLNVLCSLHGNIQLIADFPESVLMKILKQQPTHVRNLPCRPLGQEIAARSRVPDLLLYALCRKLLLLVKIRHLSLKVQSDPG